MTTARTHSVQFSIVPRIDLPRASSRNGEEPGGWRGCLLNSRYDEPVKQVCNLLLCYISQFNDLAVVKKGMEGGVDKSHNAIISLALRVNMACFFVWECLRTFEGFQLVGVGWLWLLVCFRMWFRIKVKNSLNHFYPGGILE